MSDTFIERESCHYPAFCTEDRYEMLPNGTPVQPGDIIPIIGRCMEVVKTGAPGVVNYHYPDGRMELAVGRHHVSSASCYSQVLRPRKVAVPAAQVAQVTKSGLWNGTCGRCGKGTYEGAWKLEHEGGPCQAHLGVVRR